MMLPSPSSAIGVDSAQQRVDGIRAALERHAHPVGAFRLHQPVHVERWRRRCALVAQRFRLGLGIGDKLVHGLHIERRVHRQGLHQIEKIHHRLQRPLVERQVLEQVRVVDDGVGQKDADRVAVGSGIRAGAGANVVCAAGTVLHHDGLAPALVQLVADRAHEDVAQAAGAEIGDRTDHAGRIFLRVRGGGNARQQRNKRRQNPTMHDVPPRGALPAPTLRERTTADDSGSMA